MSKSLWGDPVGALVGRDAYVVNEFFMWASRNGYELVRTGRGSEPVNAMALIAQFLERGEEGADRG